MERKVRLLEGGVYELVEFNYSSAMPKVKHICKGTLQDILTYILLEEKGLL